MKYQYTVCQGGKPEGNCRYAQPVRTTYRIASTMSHRGCFLGRPPVFGAGSSSSINSHWASVRSGGNDAGATPDPYGRSQPRRAAETPPIMKRLKHALSQLPAPDRSDDGQGGLGQLRPGLRGVEDDRAGGCWRLNYVMLD